MPFQEEESIELNKRPHRRPPRQVPQKCQPPKLLFCAFIFWTALSLAASIIVFTGLYMPYWIRGSYHQAIDVSFGAFRRCNYPSLNEQGQIQIVPQCGRYKAFGDIPSFAWKLTTILCCSGSALSFLVAFTLLFACCVPYSLRPANGRTLIILQMLSLLLVLAGCALYPMGWGNQEVRDVCGAQTMPYEIGSCHLSLSTYLLGSGMLCLLTCLLFGLISVSKLRRASSKTYDSVVIMDRL